MTLLTKPHIFAYTNTKHWIYVCSLRFAIHKVFFWSQYSHLQTTINLQTYNSTLSWIYIFIMLKNVNAKFSSIEIPKNYHFSRIPNEVPKHWKYASFEEAEIVRSPYSSRCFGIKKAFLRNACFSFLKVWKIA